MDQELEYDLQCSLAGLRHLYANLVGGPNVLGFRTHEEAVVIATSLLSRSISQIESALIRAVVRQSK